VPLCGDVIDERVNGAVLGNLTALVDDDQRRAEDVSDSAAAFSEGGEYAARELNVSAEADGHLSRDAATSPG